MRLRLSLAITTLSTALVLAASCGGDGTCPAGYTEVNGVCMPRVTDAGGKDRGSPDSSRDGTIPERTITCTSDKQCSQYDLVCDKKKGICVECAAHTDCPAGYICRGNRCTKLVKCRTTKECPAGKVCDKASGYCEECLENDDCKKEQHCKDQNS